MEHKYPMIAFALALFPFLGFAQVSFSDSTSLLSTSDFNSGVAVAVVDMNGDGKDDIIRLDEATFLEIEYQTDSSFTNYEYGFVTQDNEWAICVADIDNDGKNDILSAGAYNQTKVLHQQSPTEFTRFILPGNNHFAQGSNFADINNDGYLDIFSCHDDAESKIWGNDRNGSFREANDWIDMRTTPNSDNSGNYGSIWTDFDNDGDLDLYIAKCRIGVNSQTDPRRINALYVNDGKGNFTEEAEEYGLKIGYQSWTSDFQDIDNDGDMDCFITNHDFNVQILENDGAGYFTDITDSTGVDAGGQFIQGVMRDFDNDGFVDILTAGVQGYYHNNGDKTFTFVENAIPALGMNSFALGDLDHNGFLDIYAVFQNPYNNPSNQDDKLFLNNGNENNFITFTLEGTTSNRNGIGAKIEIYGEWGMQIREVRSGESYGIMNSFNQHFGLGTATTVDSVVVKWPSGSVDIFNNLEVNTFVNIQENSGCTTEQPIIDTPVSDFLCPDASMTLEVNAAANYVWSNGDTTATTTVTEPGIFNVIRTEGDCAVASDYIVVEAAPDITPSIESETPTNFCPGGSVVLIASESENYLWSTGDTTQSILVETTGDYFVAASNDCGDYPSESIAVTELDAPDLISIENDTIYEPGQAILMAEGANPHWYADENLDTLLGTGNSFTTPEIGTTTTFYVQDVHTYAGSVSNTGLAQHSGNNFSGNIYNGQLIFNALSTFTLREVTVYTDRAGKRLIELQNSAELPIDNYQIDLPGPGIYTIDLNFTIPPGEGYILTTNTTINNSELGYNSPRLRRNNSGVSYPYVIDDVVELVNSNFGDELYYYFYNWVVVEEDIECTSTAFPIDAVVELTSIAEPLSTSGIRLFPNPSAGQLQLELPESINEQIHFSILDAQGKQYLQQRLTLDRIQTLDLSTLPKGVYFVQLSTPTKAYFEKVILQ